MPSGTTIAVYLERGEKRTFACAVEWPGWCRSGRDEASALEALLRAGPRYARALRGAQLGFVAPADTSDFTVVERLTGDATTDFGAPGVMPRAADRSFKDPDLRRSRAILRASWRAFDKAAQAARGKALRKGPRGGGRELDAILEHALEADIGYMAAFGWKARVDHDADADTRCDQVRREMLDGLAASERGELPAKGPRGGIRWKPRFAVRRSAWHWLDHAWEIEDRAVSHGG